MAGDSAGVPRTTSGVRPPEPPSARWDPGARYRPSLLSETPVDDDVAAPAAYESWALPGRLFRGPAQRKAVFDRPVWSPRPGRARGPRERSAAELADAVERYRRGGLSTTGLVRAVGRALAV